MFQPEQKIFHKLKLSPPFRGGFRWGYIYSMFLKQSLVAFSIAFLPAQPAKSNNQKNAGLNFGQ